MQSITPFLWFNDQAEAAMNFYVSVFRNSRILGVRRYGEAGPGPKGSVMTASFVLDGQEFMALNGGPHYGFTPATSFFIRCETQDEVDHFWSKLGDGGQPMPCGWVTDRFGVTWQVVPTILEQLLEDKDPARAGRVMQAMLTMSKLDIAALKRARDGD